MPVPVYFVYSAVTCGVAKASRALHRHQGGPIFKMLPLSLRALLVDLNIIDIYIYIDR
jgi:hypothetical protein